MLKEPFASILKTAAGRLRLIADDIEASLTAQDIGRSAARLASISARLFQVANDVEDATEKV